MGMFACVWQGWRGAQKAMVATCPFLTLELDLRPTWYHLSGKLRSCNHGGSKKEVLLWEQVGPKFMRFYVLFPRKKLVF